MRRVLTLVWFASTALPLLAQSSFVVPPRATVSRPGAVWSDSRPQFEVAVGGSQARVQYAYDATGIPISQGMLRSLQFRRDHR